MPNFNVSIEPTNQQATIKTRSEKINAIKRTLYFRITDCAAAFVWYLVIFGERQKIGEMTLNWYNSIDPVLRGILAIVIILGYFMVGILIFRWYALLWLPYLLLKSFLFPLSLLTVICFGGYQLLKRIPIALSPNRARTKVALFAFYILLSILMLYKNSVLEFRFTLMGCWILEAVMLMYSFLAWTLSPMWFLNSLTDAQEWTKSVNKVIEGIKNIKANSPLEEHKKKIAKQLGSFYQGTYMIRELMQRFELGRNLTIWFLISILTLLILLVFAFSNAYWILATIDGTALPNVKVYFDALYTTIFTFVGGGNAVFATKTAQLLGMIQVLLSIAVLVLSIASFQLLSMDEAKSMFENIVRQSNERLSAVKALATENELNSDDISAMQTNAETRWSASSQIFRRLLKPSFNTGRDMPTEINVMEPKCVIDPRPKNDA